MSFSESLEKLCDRIPQESEVLHSDEPHLTLKIRGKPDPAFFSPFRRYGFSVMVVEARAGGGYVVKGVWREGV